MPNEIKPWMLAALLGVAVAVGGCGTRRFTDTPRTATEQMLIAAAVDRAADQLDFAPLEDRKVFIDDKLVDRVDKTFVVASVRARALAAGALLTEAADKADYVVELRSGAVGVDRTDYILGIPATSVPTPVGTAPLPEVALYKSVKQAGASRISFVVYRRDDRRFLYASGPAFGFSNQNNWWLFGGGPVVRGSVKSMQDEPETPAEAEPTTQPASGPSEIGARPQG